MQYEERNIHRPGHVLLDSTIYFITVRTINHNNFFNTDDKKNILHKIIKEACIKFENKLIAWVLIDNHYHLLIKIKIGLHLPDFMGYIGGKSSFLLNNLENKQGRKIWNQYWDYCIRGDKDFWTHFNYIHNNPVKHGLCGNIEEAFKYPFSSAENWVKIKGEEWMYELFAQYPIADFSCED